MLQSPLSRLKIGRGLRGGSGRLGAMKAGPRGLPPAPTGVPHIRPHGPSINMGAVAQRSTLAQDRARQFADQDRPQPHPLDLLSPPKPQRLPKMSRTQRLQQKMFQNAPSELPATTKQKRQTKQQELIAASHPIQAGILPIQNMGGVAGWGQNLLTEVGQTAIGLGPGLYHTGGGMIHDPVGTTANLAKAIGHSYGQTIHHPLRQLQQDPLGFITNVLTPMFMGAGAAARAAELSRTAQALRTGELTKLQAISAVGKTLMRPQQMERSIKVMPGLRISPPAFKSALGGYMQTKLFDPLTEKAIQAGKLSGTRNKLESLGREFKAPDVMSGVGPSGHVGKLMRKDFEQQMQMRRGLEEVKVQGHMKPGGALADVKPSEAQKIAYGRGAAKAHLDLWHSLYNGGAGHDEAFLHDPQGYVGIRKPPEQVKMKAYSNEQGVARQFRSMVETDPKKLAADPHAFSYIPKGTWQKMKLYQPGTGSAAKAIDMIDRGTQMIRIGRFLHPGYAAWAVQNGILHMSQAGMFAFRNAWQLRHDFSRLTPEEKAVFDNSVGAGHFGGGIARATQGSESSKFAGMSKKLAGFWHTVDDKYWRRMSLIHELNHAGYHSAEDWAHLMRTDNPRFRKIAMKAQDQAINYAEMSPAERGTLQKLFTAWGWTRGASTYTMRFPFEHPVQGRIAEEVGRQGNQQVNNFYAGKNGMVPNWLRGYLPLGHSNHPFMLSGGVLNPGETFGNLLSEVPGLTKGQTESLAQEEAPVPATLQEIISGMTRYGKKLQGNQRITQPLHDLAHRFAPFSALQNVLSSKKGGGTFAQGPLLGAAQFAGVPLEKLNDAKQTAALGMKDYEQSLSRPDEIDFRYHLSLQRLGAEAQLFARHGTHPSAGMLSKVRNDLEAVHTRDLFQYNFAKSHGANSYRSLPAINKVHGAIVFMTQHRIISPGQAAQFSHLATSLKDDSQLESLATELWSDTGIGEASNLWKNSLKDIQPPTLTPPRG